MSRRENEDYPKHPRQQALPLIWIFAAAALLLVAGVGVWWASASADSGVARMGPRLAVDQERIDFGRVPLDRRVRAEFKITNAGDRALTLDASAPIQVIQGC